MPAPNSTYSTLACLFHAYGLRTSFMSSFSSSGPFSLKRPASEEAPGPPLNHHTSGSVAGARSDSV